MKTPNATGRTGIHADRFRVAKTGDEIILQRKPNQTEERFKGQVQVLRSQYKIALGIASEQTIFENHAVVKITRGIDNPLPEGQRRMFDNPRRKDRKPGEVKTIYQAPEPEPVPVAAEPAKPAAVPEMREDESRFWRALFKQSLALMPSADPTKHAANARAGVEAYRARFAQSA